MQRRGFAKTIGLAIVVVAVIGVLMYSLVQPSVGWPKESRRYVHAKGFSIIGPEQWESHIDDGESGSTAAVKFVPKTPVGGTPWLTAAQIHNTPTDGYMQSKKYTQTTFQGKPAWERVIDYSDYTKEHMRSIVFERDGQWYEISVRSPLSEPVDAGVWEAYVESFRTETPRPATARALPTTIPLDLLQTPATAP